MRASNSPRTGLVLLTFILPALAALTGCQPGQPSRAPESPDPESRRPPVAESPLQIPDRYPGEPEIDVSQPLTRPTDSGAGTFVSLDAGATGIDFDNVWEQNPATQAALGTSFISSGVAVGDYDRDGRPDIYLTRQEDGGRLYRNLGDMKFEDVTQSAGIDPAGMWSGGAAFVDLTNDGWLDLYVYGYGCPNRLYVNDGQGHFSEQAARYGLDYDGASVTAAYGDYDQDGDLDVFLVTNRLDGHKMEPLPGEQITVPGVNGEKTINPKMRERYYLQAHPEEGLKPEPGGEYDHLYRNDGDRFVDVSLETSIGEFPFMGLSANWVDFDNDGRLDLYVANDFKGPDQLYRNNGPNAEGQITFSDVMTLALPHTPWFSMGSDFGDINHDGLVDYFATDMAGTSHYRDKLSMGAMSGPDSDAWFLNWPTPPQYMRNCFFLNTGNRRFMEVAAMTGMASTDWTWTVKLDDLDNDGRADVFFTNGMSRDTNNGDLLDTVRNSEMEVQEQHDFWWNQPRFELENMAFRNLGDLQFENVGDLWGLDHLGVSTGAATADFDGDGDLDMVVNGFGEPARLYRNDLNSDHVIQFRFRGASSNRDGLGVRVDLVPDRQSPVQTKWLAAGRGFASSSDLVMHFGLGDRTTVEQVVVTWPSGLVQTFDNLPADHLYTVTERGEIRMPVSTWTRGPGDSPSPTMFEASDAFRNARHVERPYDDFEREPLLPNKHSRLGPGVAWGDVDGDGDDDLWFGQAAGQGGQLYLNHGKGKFKADRQRVFSRDAECEDLGAAFVDTDRDGDLDLYVVSGGVECQPGDEVLRDRLYLNDGDGKFKKAGDDVLPDLRNSGSVVAPVDVDRDGDLDLFVGSRIVPGSYPVTPESTLLINENGTFVDGTDRIAPGLKTAGMVTSAVWADANDDGWQDLMLSIDWGSPRLFLNEAGRLVDRSDEAGLAGHLGWFTSVSAGDVDNDGDLDFVMGNFGRNTKYKATADKPELLFYGDFENNGQMQIVEAKYENGVCLPRRGLGCTSDAMPTVREKLPTYHEFAISPLADIYTPDGLDNAERYEANWLDSSLLLNQGSKEGVPVFEIRALPHIAQVSPVFGSTLTDVDGDGNLDLYVVQNFHGPQRETGNMDGGVSLLMLGDGSGEFRPVWPNRSGLLVGGDAAALAVTDINADQRPDFLVSVNNDNPLVFENRSPSPFVKITLDAGDQRPVTGSRLAIQRSDGSRQVLHLHGGGSYLSQSTAALFAASGDGLESIEVRWPDGTTETFMAPEATADGIRLTAGQGGN